MEFWVKFNVPRVVFFSFIFFNFKNWVDVLNERIKNDDYCARDSDSTGKKITIIFGRIHFYGTIGTLKKKCDHKNMLHGKKATEK